MCVSLGRSAPHFTDEEKSGKYLDLNEIHRQFINLRFAEKISYLEFLETKVGQGFVLEP